MRPILTLMGPTASGKTKAAIELAKTFPIEIVNVDSALIYRGMDIGTAKPEPDLLKKVPHHLIDIRDPSEPYSVANFVEDALTVIQKIESKGGLPLLTGGTMLYFKALITGISELPEANDNIRQKIKAEAEKKGWAWCHDKLKTIDSEAALRIHPNDTQRIQRALEVYEITGQSLSDLQQASKPNENFQWFQTAILPSDRLWLHERIARRFQVMLKQGFVEEVKALQQREDLHESLPSMRAVGYRQIWQYLEGQYDYDTMVQKGIAATRQLAKRQLTWLRNWSGLHCFENAEQLLLEATPQIAQMLKQK